MNGSRHYRRFSRYLVFNADVLRMRCSKRITLHVSALLLFGCATTLYFQTKLPNGTQSFTIESLDHELLPLQPVPELLQQNGSRGRVIGTYKEYVTSNEGKKTDNGSVNVHGHYKVNEEGNNKINEGGYFNVTADGHYKIKEDGHYNINEDVIVFIHVQKTGGTTFNEHLVKHLNIPKPCLCTGNIQGRPCKCLTEAKTLWLFSWYTVGWPCGLHADWTGLHECVDETVHKVEGKTRSRRCFYITILREPVKRYISEWKHQAGGRHWQDAILRCNGLFADWNDVRPCFSSSSWRGVTLEKFMACEDNLATNRQTRMLADLSKSNCYRKKGITQQKRKETMLRTAIDNLRSMKFFGLTEYQSLSQELFEYTFGLKFRIKFTQNVQTSRSKASSISESQRQQILKYVDLDLEFYKYAKELFLRRANDMKVAKGIP